MRRKKLVLNMNSHGVVTFLRDFNYAHVIRSADIIYPDGWGPVIASRLFKNKLQERINVGDFIGELLNKSSSSSSRLRLYLLGCEKDTVYKTVHKIKEQYPNITICGYHHGFFSKTQERLLIKDIQESKPHIVLVGMGIPKQEIWIHNNWPTLPNAVYMGIGGVFYYIAGIKSRAPKWMRDNALEWLFRLAQEPRRLWKRYVFGNLFFIYYVIKSLLRDRLFEQKKNKNRINTF